MDLNLQKTYQMNERRLKMKNLPLSGLPNPKSQKTKVLYSRWPKVWKELSFL